MQLIDPSEWQPTGHVTVWQPDAAMTQALSAAPAEDTPLSFLQNDHVKSVLIRRIDGKPHRAYTASSVSLPAPVDKERLTQVINDFLGAHEGLRASIEVDEATVAANLEAGNTFAPLADALQRHLLAAADVSMEPVALPDATAAGANDSTGSLADRLNDYFADTAVSDHFPALAIALIEPDEEPADGQPATAELVLALDHAIGDGISQVVGIMELAMRYMGSEAALAGVERPSYLAYVRDEYAAAATVTPESPGAQLWEECIEFCGGVPRLSLELGLEEGELQPVRIAQGDGPMANPEQLNALRAFAKSKGYSFSTVIYALLGLAHKRLTGKSRYATVTVSSTRGAEYGLSIGWFANFNPLFFDINGDTIEEIIDDVAAAHARMMATLGEPVHASLGSLLMTGKIGPEVFQSPQMVTYLDLSWFPEPEGLNLRLFGGIGQTKNANMWLARQSGSLEMGSQAPDNEVAQTSLANYFGEVQAIVAETVGRLQQDNS